MTLHVENLNKLIAHLEAQPPDRINMAHWTAKRTGCGCYIAHAREVFPDLGIEALGLAGLAFGALVTPRGHEAEALGVRRYPAHRVIATLKRLLAHYLATGEVKVDWGPEPGDEPAQPRSAPQAVEIIKPALPAELTRLLGEPRPAAADAEG